MVIRCQPQPVVLAVPCRGIHLAIPSIPHFIAFSIGCQSSWLPLRPFRDFGWGEVRRGVTSEYRIPGHPPEGLAVANIAPNTDLVTMFTAESVPNETLPTE